MKRCDTAADTISKSTVQQQAGRDDTTLGGATALQSITCSQFLWAWLHVLKKSKEARKRIKVVSSCVNEDRFMQWAMSSSSGSEAEWEELDASQREGKAAATVVLSLCV